MVTWSRRGTWRQRRARPRRSSPSLSRATMQPPSLGV